jgi:Asp-tRNA(Asn)/Glu-tRNA(Gln) amidotransferase A subunit family amidase
MKPTLGLVSRSGIIPISSSQDTAGPIGKDVETVARVLSVISGSDEHDPSTNLIPDGMNLDFTELDFRKNLSDYRIGLLTSGLDDPDGAGMLADLKVAIDTLDGSWVEPKDERVYPGEAEYFVLLYEFKVGLERYLASSKTKKKKLSELIDFNNRNKQIAMPHFGQDIFFAAEKAGEKPAKYQDSLIELKDTKKETLAIFSDNQVDVLVGLTRGPAWEIDYAGGDSEAIKRAKSFGNGGYAAISGLPHITIPAYQIDGYPVGVSVIGRPWEDLLVLQVAAVLETFFRGRFPKS